MDQQPGVNSGASEGQKWCWWISGPGSVSTVSTTPPYVRDWANNTRAAGLVVIGVHTPEYPLGAFVAPAAPGGEGLADNLPGGGG